MNALLLSIFYAVCAVAQPVPHAVSFAWDAPTDMAGLVAYRLQWGPSFAVLNLNRSNYTVEGFPIATNQRVSIRSVAAGGEMSDETAIRIFHISAVLEESGGTSWRPVATNHFTREITTNALFRVRLEGTRN